MSKLGLHCPFGHLKHMLWSKERLGVKLTIWLPTTKSRESTQIPCMQAACNIPLENFQRGLQFCLRPHCNQRSARKVMGPQSRESPSLGTKCHLDVGPVEGRIKYYKGEGGGFPQVWVVVNLVSPNCPWIVLTTKVFQLCINNLVLVLCRFVWIVEAC
jgi:hypothetical protein